MIPKIKKTLLLYSLLTASHLLLPSPASAQTQEWASGVCVASNISGAEDVATIQGIQCLVANVLSIFITTIGLAGFVMLIYSSFKVMLSGSNSKGLESARNSVTFAIVGLVVALSSFFILNIIAQFTGVDSILDFVIPGSSKDWF